MANKKRKIPVYKMTVDDTEATGVEFISLVESPAIEVNWVAMSKSLPVKMAVAADKQMLFGPAMIPDLPIYRFDEETQREYYVQFDKQTIDSIVKKFFTARKTLSINYEHTPGSQVDAVITESWITSANDKSKDMGFDLPEGTWMLGVYIQDKEFWKNEVKSGNIRGFSIEGALNLDTTKAINQITQHMNKIEMTEVKTKDGMTIVSKDEVLVEGSLVFTVDEAGVETPVADGNVILETGETITVKDGAITAIAPAEAPEDEIPVAQAEVELAEYPGGWDQCVIDMTEKYGSKDAADRVCGAIKGGTVKHAAAVVVEETPIIAEEVPVAEAMTLEEVSKMLASINDRLTALEGAKPAMSEDVKTELAAIKKEMTDKFSKTPGGSPSTEKKDVIIASGSKKQTINDKIERLAEFRKKHV